MLFTSFQFLLFFVVIFSLYWITPSKYRWILLLIASYFFYISWEPAYIILILTSTLIDYLLCKNLTQSNYKRKSRLGLTLSIFLNLGLLFFFKYFNFFQSSLALVLGKMGIDYEPSYSSFLLPVGISFYTFQTLSYSIDVYRRKIPVEKHLGKFALYVAYFPQLVAGPIERADTLLKQFNQKATLQLQNLKEGATLFIWGLFKKVVVADNLRILADHTFDNFQFQSGSEVLFATFAFTVQLYADFSGYSDMAIGISRMLGIRLSTNFKTPYFSQNLTEFWRRWHITLSSWFRDYVFIPMGGSMTGRFRLYRNLFIVFVLSGIWHGAAWSFAIWGILHGTLIIIEKLVGWDRKAKSNLLRFIKIVLTFIIVMLAMLPMRIENVSELFRLWSMLLEVNFNQFIVVVYDNLFMPGLFATGILFVTDLFIARDTITDLKKLPVALQYTWVCIITLAIFFLGDAKSEAFFYFQF